MQGHTHMQGVLGHAGQQHPHDRLVRQCSRKEHRAQGGGGGGGGRRGSSSASVSALASRSQRRRRRLGRRTLPQLATQGLQAGVGLCERV